MDKVLRLSAPSYVIPGNIYDNCMFLKQYVSGISLAFFEAKVCLGYTEKDLPLTLKDMEDIRYHLHLPLDLDWTKPELAAKICWELWQKTSFLKPWAGVLHPEQSRNKVKSFLQTWIDLGGKPEQILLENIKDIDLSQLWDVVVETNVGICLDTGHLFAYGQENILALPGFWEKIDLVHFYGQEKGRTHYGLEYLSNQGWDFFKEVLNKLKDGAEIVLELFAKDSFLSSYQILKSKKRELGVNFV